MSGWILKNEVHAKDLKTGLAEMKEESADVQLVCEDQKIEAHRVVLGAMSEGFRNILKNVPASGHPIIYMNNVNYADLKLVVDFIYYGEIRTSSTEELGSFKILAETLKVKGATPIEDPVDKTMVEDLHEKDLFNVTQKEELHHSIELDDDVMEEKAAIGVTTIAARKPDKENMIPTIVLSDDDEPATTDREGSKKEKLRDRLRNMMIHYCRKRGQVYICTICGHKTKTERGIFYHIESKHIEDHAKLACSRCNKIMSNYFHHRHKCNGPRQHPKRKRTRTRW